MRLDVTNHLKPIIFDVGTLPEAYKRDHGVKMAFRAGEVSLGDPLQDAVARGGGINQETGELDMAMLAAVDLASSYVDGSADREGMQGQPFLLADVSRTMDRRVESMRGHIGFLALDSPAMRISGDTVGLRCEGPFRSFRAQREAYNPDRQTFRFDGRDTNTSTTVPLVSSEMKLGSPDGNAATETIQELIAGRHVIEWLGVNFPDLREGYLVYRGLMDRLLVGRNPIPESVEALLEEPYLSRAVEEKSMLSAAERILAKYQFTVTNLQRQMDGAIGEANLALAVLEEANPDFDIPKTRESNYVKVTAPVDGDRHHGSAKSRLEALDSSRTDIIAITNAAIHTGKLK